MTVAASSPSRSRIKFHLAGGAQPLILVPVQVNGRGPFQFILDTGAGTSLLSPEVAKELALETLGSKEGQTAGGAIAVSLSKADSLGVGDLRVENVDLGIVDLSQIARTVGAKIDGDLGYNFLKFFRVTIDYTKCEIHFDDPRRVEKSRGAQKTEVPIRLANPAKPLILVDVHLNGKGPFQFAIDTGTSTTALTETLARELRLTTTPIGPVTTGGAPAELTASSLDSFQVGGARMNDVPVVIGSFFEMLSKAVGVELAGIVGYNFLRNYRVVIDYPNEVLRLL